MSAPFSLGPYITNITKDHMIATKNRIKKHVKRTSGKLKRKELEAIRMKAKHNAPGFPPNTCPYIDVTINMVTDMLDCYKRLNEKGEQSPVVDEISQHAQDTLEYIRKANESLRDNSSYWYHKYKDLLLARG